MNTPIHYFPGELTLVLRFSFTGMDAPVVGLRSFATSTAMCVLTGQDAAIAQHVKLFPNRLFEIHHARTPGVTLDADPAMIRRLFHIGMATCTRLLHPALAGALGEIVRCVSVASISTGAPPSRAPATPETEQ